MKRFVYAFRWIAAAIVAAPRAVVRRLRHGPRVRGWTWSEELFVAVSRAVFVAMSSDVARMAPRNGGPKPPLGRHVRDALTVTTVDLNGVAAERYCPTTTPAGTILHFHGGGFVTGSVAMERRVAAQQAVAAHCDTYNVDYRLAPAHPYPAALDDAITAYRAVLDRGADPQTTILFGGSAGACLALSTLLKMRELQLPQPAGAVLLWPYADFTFSGATIQTNADLDMLPVRDLAHVWGPAYVGAADPTDPLVSPVFADLSGLAPLLILAGGAESLLSCAERIAHNARAAGVDTQFSVYPDKVHGWMLLPRLPASVQAVEEVNTWIRGRLAP